MASEKLSAVLIDCYMRHSTQAESSGNGAVALQFKKRAYKCVKEDIHPYNPLELGIDMENGLDVMLTNYKRLMNIRDNSALIEKEYNMIGYLQCLFDCWVGENIHSSDGIIRSSNCKNVFLYNIDSFEDKIFQSGRKDSQIDGIHDGKRRSGACESLYFEAGRYTPNEKSRNTIDRISKHTGKFEPYLVVITADINSMYEANYATILAKKRIMFIKDLLLQYGIPHNKIKGKLNTEQSKIHAIQDGTGKKLSRIRICVVDGIKEGSNAKELIEKFDYDKSYEKWGEVKRIK